MHQTAGCNAGTAGLGAMAVTKQVPHLRWSQAPPLPWRRPGSADFDFKVIAIADVPCRYHYHGMNSPLRSNSLQEKWALKRCTMGAQELPTALSAVDIDSDRLLSFPRRTPMSRNLILAVVDKRRKRSQRTVMKAKHSETSLDSLDSSCV